MAMALLVFPVAAQSNSFQISQNQPESPTATARLQVAHLAPFAASAPVTIKLNGVTALTNFDYGDSTAYIDLPEGTVDLTGGSDYTAIAIGDGVNQPLSLKALLDNNTAPAAGNFKLRLGHLAPFANTLAGTTADVRLDDGTVILNDVVFGDVAGYLELAAGTYDLKITTPDGGTTLIDLAPVSFTAGQIVSTFAVGEGSNQPLGGYALPSNATGFFLPLEYVYFFPIVNK
jgi:hypothetical protein